MPERMSIISPTGHLGFTPIERGSFEIGLARRPDAIVADSGSCDIGPQPLGADEHSSPEWQRHDLELMLLAARRLGVPMIVGSASDAGTDRGVHQYNTPEAPGHGMHAEMRRSLAFSQDGDWLFAPDMHDRGVRILNLASGKAYPVFTGDAPFYKAMSVSVPSSLVALLHPGDVQGRGPYGLEVWRLTYSTR